MTSSIVIAYLKQHLDDAVIAKMIEACGSEDCAASVVQEIEDRASNQIACANLSGVLKPYYIEVPAITRSGVVYQKIIKVTNEK